MGQPAHEDRSDPSSLCVLAAGSLQAPFEALAAEWARRSSQPVLLSFANARDLAQRIEDGEPADVFASASPEHPALLHASGLLDRPRPFASNHLVVAVPAGSRARSPRVLAEPGTRVVIEVAGIPLGDYTRQLLAELDTSFGAGFARAVLANVVGQEQTVAAVIDRLCSGQADAAVLYSTDLPPAAGRLRAIAVPVQIRGTYVIARVRATRRARTAEAWLALTHGPAGARLLAAAGFDPVT